MEPVRFASGLDGGCERRRRIKGDPESSDLSSWEDGLPFTKKKKRTGLEQFSVIDQ